MATVQIRLDDGLRDQAALVAQGMGLDLSSVVRVFLLHMIRTNGFPFQVSSDPFYSESNMKFLHNSIQQINDNKVVIKTIEDLESME